MSKRKTVDYRPLSPRERLFAYISLVITTTLALTSAKTNGLSHVLIIYTPSSVIAMVCALVAFWDARLCARMIRRGVPKRRIQCSGFMSAPFMYTDAGNVEWPFFDDPAPTRTT